jgi:hypothetical protein
MRYDPGVFTARGYLAHSDRGISSFAESFFLLIGNCFFDAPPVLDATRVKEKQS